MHIYMYIRTEYLYDWDIWTSLHFKLPYNYKYVVIYLKGTIVCEYYFLAIFVTGGKNAQFVS